MLGMVSNYSPREHTIITGELDLFVKRLVEGDEARRGKLFVVRYNKIGSFVIAEWLGKPRDVFVDIMNLGKSLASFDKAKAAELRHRLFDPVSAEETSRAIAEEESNFLHNMQDWNSYEHEREERCMMGE